MVSGVEGSVRWVGSVGLPVAPDLDGDAVAFALPEWNRAGALAE